MNYFTPVSQYLYTAKSELNKKFIIYKNKLQDLTILFKQGSLYQSTLVIVIPVLAIGLFVGVTYLSGSHADQHKDLSISYGNQQASSSVAPKSSQSKSGIKVDISGAVKDPGVKLLDSDARVNDALLAAGGYSDQADQQFLAQALNLAQKLNDGDKIYIPAKGQVAATTTAAVNIVNPISPSGTPLVSNVVAPASKSVNNNSTTGTKAVNSTPTPTGPIHINSASQTELESLPGIGPVYAQAIINGRPYTDTQQLCTQKIVKNSTTCQKIQSLIAL